VAVRRLSAVVFAALIGAFVFAVPAQGATVTATIDGISYQANDTNVATGATITGSGVVGPNLVIPSSVVIGGTTYAVKQIGGDAFRNKGLTSVVIPNSVTAVQPYSFASNLLTSITVPSSVGYLNTGAFAYNDLTSVTLNEGLTSIGPGTFYDNALTSIVIPASVYTITGSAFGINPNLTTITFNGNAPALGSPIPLGTSNPLIRFYADATGFTTPTWNGGSSSSYATQVIPNAVVTFDANGHGTAPAAASGRPGFAAADPGALSATGFTFDGWFTSASGGTQASFPYTAASSVTLYAHWSRVMHAVTVDHQDGTTPELVPIAHGSDLSLSDATYVGHTFTGWFTAASGGSQVTFPYTVTGDTTVYAHWNLNEYTVTFEPGNAGPPSVTAADYGTTIAEPATPSRQGFSFDGWFTAASGGSQVAFPYTVSGDTTLYAQWTSTSLTLTLELQNGQGAWIGDYDGPITVAGIFIPTFADHTFTGWWTAPTGGELVVLPYSISTDTTWYAQWTIDSYAITFEPGNGDEATTNYVDSGATVSEPADPTRTGYTFTGWFTQAEGGTEVAFPYTVTAEAIFYAQWAIDTYTIAFEPGNGDEALSENVDYGTTVSEPAEPTRTGYSFAGWFTAATEGTEVSFPYTVTDAVTLYAQWDVREYAVTFEPGNGDAATTVTADYGTTVNEPYVPTRAGHSFGGWYTEESGGDQVMLPYTVEGDVTLYARWEINSYVVTFEPVNGDASTEQTADFESTISAPADPARASYEFAGWFTAQTGGTEVTFPYTVTHHTTLYAQWERVAASFAAPDRVAPGSTVSISGENFIPGESVEIWLRSTPVRLATVTVSADGTFSTSVVIPADTVAGDHHFELRTSESGTLSSAVTVSDGLSSTGAEITATALFAALLLLGGLVVIARSRRTL